MITYKIQNNGTYLIYIEIRVSSLYHGEYPYREGKAKKMWLEI